MVLTFPEGKKTEDHCHLAPQELEQRELIILANLNVGNCNLDLIKRVLAILGILEEEKK